MLKVILTKSFQAGDTVFFVNNAGINTGGGGATGRSEPVATQTDWYDSQTLGLTNSTVFWKSVAPKPLTSNFVAQDKVKMTQCML